MGGRYKQVREVCKGLTPFQVREEGMAGRKSYLEASIGCAKKMKETGTLLVQSVTSEKKSGSKDSSQIS